MENSSNNEILLNRIRDAILDRISGSDSLETTRDKYKNLLSEYAGMGKKHVSDDASGFLKGLLFHHNKKNSANLTSLYFMKDNIPFPVGFCGDKVLMNAVPEIITREFSALKEDSTARIRLGGEHEQGFSMVLRKFTISREAFLLAAVTSSDSFNINDFNFLSELLAVLFAKSVSVNSPVVLDYINDISSEISRIMHSGKGAGFFIDHFMLLNPYEAFSHIGIFPMINFSEFVTETLKKTYPSNVRIFALSVFQYLVLYDEKIKEDLDIKRNKIDIIFQGNSIPYKVLHKAIDSPQALYLFLEGL